MTPDVLSLDLNPADKILLAYVCQRAALNEQNSCTDTNAELAQAVRINARTIPRLVSQLEEARCLTVTIQAGQGNARSLQPRPALLTAYRINTPPDNKLPPSTQNTYTPLAHSAYTPSTQNAYTPLSSQNAPAGPAVKTAAKSSVPVSGKPVRTCPLTGLDVTHQRFDQRLASSDTLDTLRSNDSVRFNDLVARYLPGQPDAAYPRALAEAIRDYDKQHPSTVFGSRLCPITGIDVSHQGISYPVATAATIKLLYKTDRAGFAALMSRCGQEAVLHTPMSTQLWALKHYVDQQILERGLTIERRGVIRRGTSTD